MGPRSCSYPAVHEWAHAYKARPETRHADLSVAALRIDCPCFPGQEFPSLDHKQSLPVFHRFGVFHQNRLDDASLVGLDLVEHLHGFDDA